MDVRVSEDEMVVFADLPGVESDAITVTVTGTDLYIRGSREFLEEGRCDDYVQVERMHGSFEGRVPLAKNVDREGIDTNFDCGILTVRLPIRRAD
jgi:HSP20 family protein